mgnify:CR=1 FL=1
MLDIFTYIEERRTTLTKDDYAVIQDMTMAVSIEEYADAEPWLYERLHMIISAPEYTGDMALDDLEE